MSEVAQQPSHAPTGPGCSIRSDNKGTCMFESIRPCDAEAQNQRKVHQCVKREPSLHLHSLRYELSWSNVTVAQCANAHLDRLVRINVRLDNIGINIDQPIRDAVECESCMEGSLMRLGSQPKTCIEELQELASCYACPDRPGPVVHMPPCAPWSLRSQTPVSMEREISVQ